MDLALTVFPSSAEAERDRRNSFKGYTVNQLLGVRLLTADVGIYEPAGKVMLIIKGKKSTGLNSIVEGFENSNTKKCWEMMNIFLLERKALCDAWPTFWHENV